MLLCDTEKRMLGKIYTGTLNGIDGSKVTIEADISRGLPVFNLVGLPDRTVREAKERIIKTLIQSIQPSITIKDNTLLTKSTTMVD